MQAMFEELDRVARGRTIRADRGYGEQSVEDELRGEGVRYPVLQRKGRPTAARRQIEHPHWNSGME